MFQNARLKLTAWYLLIIMIISVSFSLVIFNFLSNEVDRFAQSQRFRFERRFLENGLPPPLIVIDPELVSDTKNRLALVLLLIDVGILFISGGLGYVLAGKTLKPIQTMLDDQNRFITDASHEFRTPLTSLKSALEVSLRDKKLTLKEAKNLISENIDDVNRLQSLSDNLLKLAQYQKLNPFTNFTQVDLKAVISTAIRRVNQIAAPKEISIKDLSSPLTFTANKDSLVDLLVIILDNAIKYSPSQGIINITTINNSDSVFISIIDQGIGIDPKDLPHIFDRFYQAATARSKVGHNGYGLGLSIAKNIAESHHGIISVKSQPGQGSTFTIKLPLIQPKFS